MNASYTLLYSGCDAEKKNHTISLFILLMY